MVSMWVERCLKNKFDIFTYKVYKGAKMTAKVAYKKELYSLLSNVAEMSKNYVEETHKKKIHIVALLLFILLPSAGNTKTRI